MIVGPVYAFWSLRRSSLFGCPKRIGHVFQTRYYAATGSGRNAEDVVLFQIVRAEVAQAILDLRRKSIQVLVLVHIETWKQIDKVEDIGDQRCV
jgi:hypothetical protein